MFYIVEPGKLVEGIWCDNLDCFYYSGRKGIPQKGEFSYNGMEIISCGGKDFCSPDCEEQAQGAEARYIQSLLG